MDRKLFLKFVKIINIYPPYLGAGIRLRNVNKTGTRYEVALLGRFWNKNLNGTHFGGSLYAMCDPWYVFAAASHFGNNYILWDKSASIKYLKPGKGTLTAIFEISTEKLHQMKEEVDRVGKATFTFSDYIYDKNQNKVCLVEKEIYIRTKMKK